MNNIDYYVLCVLELRPKFSSGEPFVIKDVAFDADLDKSETSKALIKLFDWGFVEKITNEPLTYAFKGINLK